ncbi:MAG: ATP synthase F0 subunit C [Planctomycetes bacterium]|nr:ATP synthase F0 subunit C [Planctomycetota bacterium]
MMRSLFSVRTLVAAVAVLALTSAGVAHAAETEASGTALIDLTHFGVGLSVIGAAFGISRLAASAYESMARQPEVAGSINTAMIIAAALIEGFTFFALYICFAK